MPTYVDKGNVVKIDKADINLSHYQYEQYVAYRFNSHTRYFPSSSKKRNELVKDLIAEVLEIKDLCKDGYYVPEEEIGGYGSSHLEAIIICKE